MTVAVVTVAIGYPFVDFLPEWWEAVDRLERQPDEVVVITDGEFSPHRFNEAVARTTTDWVCKLDVDDVILPHALNALDEQRSDVMIFGVRWGTQTWQPNGQRMMTLPDNNVTAASPFRRKVWERGPYRDMPYWDWVFWIEATHNGFAFEPSGRIDYEYRVHDDQVSLNGNHQQRVTEVLQWRERLCASS